jgi:hypothetical protein
MNGCGGGCLSLKIVNKNMMMIDEQGNDSGFDICYPSSQEDCGILPFQKCLNIILVLAYFRIFVLIPVSFLLYKIYWF